ncbi:MAG: hypothetical protein ABUS79_13215 [Pseudomonadota bacterium]
MEAFAVPLRALIEDASWFARAKEIRLLHVVTTTDLADAALGVLMAQEYHADNRTPFARLDDGFAAGDPGWKTRASRLRELHESWRPKLKEGGIVLRALPPAPAFGEPIAGFATQVRQVADSLVAPLEGLVVVLAPTRIDDPAAWAESVRSLLAAPHLEDIRWILLTRDPAAAGPLDKLIETLGPGGLAARCIPDDGAVDRDVAAALDRAASAAPGVPGPALMGAAWPRVPPPPRRGRTQLTQAEEKAALVDAGVDPPLTTEEGRTLRLLILRAAQALKTGRGSEAVRLQREARDLCDTLQMPKQAVLMELTLAAYLVYLAQRPLAAETYQKATARAEALNMPKEAAQAQLALAALHLVNKRPDLAAVTYARAGELARRGAVPLLAIEAYRLCGTYVTDTRLKADAWQKAVAIGGELDPPEAKASSAAEAARALAALLRKMGMHAQATHVEEQGVALAAGEEDAAGAARCWPVPTWTSWSARTSTSRWCRCRARCRHRSRIRSWG